MKNVLFLLILFIPVISLSQGYRGEIMGKVIDAKTQEPIVGVNIVVIEKLGAGASSGVEGTFRIEKLEVGTYSLKFSAVGFETQILTNVVVTTGRQTPVHVLLDEKIVETEGVTVRGSYFSRGNMLSPLSTNSKDRSEILRSPGGIQDVQRVVQSLPGVASSTDNINELIVRGGAPFENLTVMDNMEIPSINHYSNQYNSAGPINMLNADMIRDVQFSSGGFPAQFGDKTSSIMNISVREGNRNIGLSSSSGFNVAGAGTLVEGGFAGGKGSFIFSARQSLLQIVDKLVGISSISLTAIPRYWDTHAKVVYDLTPSQKLSFNVLYGVSRIDIKGDPKEEDELRKNKIDSSSVENIFPLNKQYVAGINYQTLWGKEGYSTLTLYTVGSMYNVDVFSDFARRVRGSSGEVLSYSILSSRSVFRQKSEESFVAAKYDLFYQFHPQHELSVGAQIATVRLWKNDFAVESDTSRYDLDHNGTFEVSPVIIPPGTFQQELSFGDASKYYFYASDKFKVAPDFAVTFGLRYDHFTYSGRGNISPRVSFSYQLAPFTSLALAGGRYYQAHPFPYYGDRRDIGYNKELENMYADHAVLSFARTLDDGLKFTLEGYYKNYSNVAVEEGFIHSADPIYWSDRFLTVGKRRSYGIELFAEQKQVKDFFGTVSISLSKTEDQDPRIPKKADWYPSDYDYPVIVTVLGGGVARGVRDWFNQTPFYIKYPSYILPFSNEMEISFKYRYQSGRPYTPKTFVTWKQFREGNIRWSDGWWVNSDQINSARYSNYSRLDLQWISRFYLNSWNINVFLAVMNVFNTKNVFYQNHRSDGTVETIYQFAFFPVGGIEVEF